MCPPREIELEQGRRVQLSLDFISERGVTIGALLSMRDAESVRRIENEIELSRRLAAIGRLTSGVAHEVKNPINAIVIHLEILRERILHLDPESRRHMDIISSEIHRLDRVVKTLVDFSRPVDLKLTALDLRSLAAQVVALAAPEALTHHVEIVQELGPRPLPIRVDTDLMMQAILNVVINGVQAMPEGGTLTLRAFATANAAVLEVQRHRRRHPSRDSRQDLQPLLHHPQGRQRNRPGPHLPRHAAAQRRIGAGHRLCAGRNLPLRISHGVARRCPGLRPRRIRGISAARTFHSSAALGGSDGIAKNAGCPTFDALSLRG